MKTMIKYTKKMLLTASAALVLTAQAFALDIGSLKDQGIVGELANGYVGIVASNAPAEVKNFVDEINAKRKQVYQGIAKKNNISIDKAEAIAGQSNIERTKNGHYINDKGAWQKK